MDPEIISQRLIDGVPERVFGAFSDPAALARWWGPAGFTNTFQEFDFKPGGIWRLVMRSSDGTEYPMQKRFIEIAAPERIDLQHLDPVHGFRMSMRFAAEGAGTRVTWIISFESAEEGKRVRHLVLDANDQNFDRLESHLVGRGVG